MPQAAELAQRALRSNSFVFGVVVVLYALASRLQPAVAVDSGLYIELADELLAGSGAVLFTPTAPHWTKIVFLSILTGARAISPSYWLYIMFAVNLICSGVAAVLLVQTVRRVTRSEAAVAVALLFYVTAFDIVHWVRFVLTDPLYNAIALAVFAIVVLDIYEPRKRRRTGLLALTIVLAALTRLPGLVLVPLAIAAEWLLVPPPEKRRYLRPAVVLFIVVAIAAPYLRAALVQDTSRWPVRYLRPRLEKMADRARSGLVLNDRPQMARPAPRTIHDHVVIQADRFVRFFQVTCSQFSRVHNLVNVAWFAPLYLLGIIGVVAGLRDPDWRRRSLVIAGLVWIFAFAWFYALTELDFDWRYRMPLLPQMIILAAAGTEVVLARARALSERRRALVSG